MSDNNLSAKDEALLILEYLENEQMSKTFLNFLDENKHLHQLRSHLYTNYENSQQINHSIEVNEFQAFFNLSKQIISQSTKNANELFFDEEFLNDLISQTPPMDYQQDTPIIQHENDDHMNTIEQLFAVQHDTPSVQSTMDTPSRLTKCIVVTQDFLQSMYTQQSPITNNNIINSIHKPKRRKRRLKVGKENYYQQRKIMPRILREK